MEETRLEFAKILLSAVLSYAALFLCAKLIGRKQIAQLNFLDYIAGITIGSIAAELATDLENMWMGGKPPADGGGRCLAGQAAARAGHPRREGGLPGAVRYAEKADGVPDGVRNGMKRWMQQTGMLPAASPTK